MNTEISTHKSGLRLVTHNMSDAPAVSLHIFVHTGSRYENLTINGVAHFFEHMVFKGTPTRPSPEQIAFELESIGAEVNAGTDREFTTYFIKVLKSNLEKGAEILFDAFLHSSLTEEEVNKERLVIKEEIKMYEDDPSSFTDELAISNIYPNDLFGRSVLGSDATLNNLTSHTIRDFFNRTYFFENTVIVAAGSISNQELGALIDKYFDVSAYSHGTDIEIDYTDTGFSTEESIYKKDIQQAQLRLSTHTVNYNDPKKYKYSVATDILGEGMGSKLFVEIREKLGLAYNISVAHETWSKSGFFMIALGLMSENVETAKTICFREIEKLANGEFTEADLHRAKELSKSSILMNMDTTDNWAMLLGIQETVYKKIEPIENIIRKIDEVNMPDVKDIMKELFSRPWQSTVVRE